MDSATLEAIGRALVVAGIIGAIIGLMLLK